MGADQYIYISAKVRALESDLLSPADLTRVIEAKTPEIAFKAFSSLDYAGELLDLEAEDYRLAMDRKLARLKKVFERTLPDENLLRLLFADKDYHNIRVLFKEKVSGRDLDEHLEQAPGLVPISQLKRYILEDASAEIDPEIKADIDDLKKQIGDQADPETISGLVEAKLDRMNNLLAKRVGSPFVEELFRLVADKSNIKTFLRGRRLGLKPVWLAGRLNRYGSVPASAFMERFEDADDAEFLDWAALKLPPSFREALEGYLKDREVWRLEKGLNNAIIRHLRQAKRVGYGPEVVVAYYFAQKFAIKNLSTIMALKFGGIEPDEIRSHLVESY